MTPEEIINELKSLADPSNLEGMKRFGVATESALGIKIPVLRKIARKYKNNHSLALQLWESGIHEAQILASYIDDPAAVTEQQMDEWVNDFKSWDVVDQCCGNLFDKTIFAFEKAKEWTLSEKEFIKRAGFTMMAELAVHDKTSENQKFISFFPLIEKEAYDERNFVKKAVNWALRQIGKRNIELRKEAIKCAERILSQPSKTAKWIARDALRELTHPSLTEGN